jgi:hypothetical protein
MAASKSNRVEIISDAETKTFKMIINGAEINRIKSYSLKGDADSYGTDVVVHFDADTLSLC